MIAEQGAAKSLAEAIGRVMADVPYVQKKGQMQGAARYSYAKEADFIDALHPALVRHGVTVAPVAVELLLSEAFETQRGGKMNRMVLRVTYRFSHAGSKETLDVVTLGEGADSGDKCANKCLTAAFKYALRQTFCVETGDDPDDTPSHQQERAAAPARAAAPKDGSNPGRRAALAQKFATCKTRNDYLATCKLVADDVKSGLLSEADREALRPVAVQTSARFPAPAEAPAE